MKMVWLVQNCRSNKCTCMYFLKPPELRGSFLEPLVDLKRSSYPSPSRVPLIPNPGSAPGYAHLFLIEREYFGFNTLESVVVE